jgi:nucleoside-diphosphate-sugar epimerase
MQMHKDTKVLVTGGAGYLGSVLVKKLLELDYSVRVVDNLTYGVDTTSALLKNPRFEFINGDIRDAGTLEKAIENIDSVIHLAAIVGDPACAQRENAAIETNQIVPLKLAELISKHSKELTRFIYASTCSVYGISSGVADEQSPLNPVSLYARTKINAEKILDFTNQRFIPCILRLSTLYGLSPRMRFDLLINEFACRAFNEKEITIYAGERWRPLLHIDDAARAFQMCLDAPISKIEAQIFNVGSDSENYDLSKLGEYFARQVPGTQINITEQIKDIRSYKVNFQKIKKELGFETGKTVEDGIREIYCSLKEGKFRDGLFDKKYYNHQR